MLVRAATALFLAGTLTTGAWAVDGASWNVTGDPLRLVVGVPEITAGQGGTPATADQPTATTLELTVVDDPSDHPAQAYDLLVECPKTLDLEQGGTVYYTADIGITTPSEPTTDGGGFWRLRLPGSDPGEAYQVAITATLTKIWTALDVAGDYDGELVLTLSGQYTP